MGFETAWAAGLIEGEGTFALVKNSKAKHGKSAKIVVQMNDLDVLERLHNVFGLGRIYYRPPRGNSKESWAWTVYKATEVKDILGTLLPYLGNRRTAKANEVIDWIEAQRA